MNLLTSVHRLRELRSVKPILATAALESRSLHLNYLSSELVIFSLFDIGVTAGEKEAIGQDLAELHTSVGTWRDADRPGTKYLKLDVTLTTCISRYDSLALTL